MKQSFVTAALTVITLLGLALDSQANGLFRRHRGGCDSGCESYESAPCATTAVAPAPVQYVDQKVTRYRQVLVPKEVEVVVARQVMREEKFTYNVQVPVTKQVAQKQTTYNRVEKQVPYTYTVCVPVTVAEKRNETIYNRVEKQVPYTYTVMVPHTVQRTVKQTRYECVRETVTEMRPVCRSVPVTCTDACGNCVTRCERVTVMEPCAHTIVKRVPIVSDVVINETICQPVTKQGTRTVCELVPVTREVVVNVCRYETQTKQGTRTVCELVPVTRDVMVNVCSYETQARTGTRHVCDTVHEKVKQTIQVCQTQAYEETVRVAVGGVASTSCASTSCGSSCSDCCDEGGHGHHRGLFRRNR